MVHPSIRSEDWSGNESLKFIRFILGFRPTVRVLLTKVVQTNSAPLGIIDRYKMLSGDNFDLVI